MNNSTKYQNARYEVSELTKTVLAQARQLVAKDEVINSLRTKARKLAKDARGHGEKNKVTLNALAAKQAELNLATKQLAEARAEIAKLNELVKSTRDSLGASQVARQELHDKLNAELHRRDLAERQSTRDEGIEYAENVLRKERDEARAEVTKLTELVKATRASLGASQVARQELHDELDRVKMAEASIASRARVEVMESLAEQAKREGKLWPGQLDELRKERDLLRADNEALNAKVEALQRGGQ